jgi:hypothetical protein
MPHRLQVEFAKPDGEQRYVDELRNLISTGQFDAAEQILLEDLAALDREFAKQCSETSRDSVILSGWPELFDAIAEFEGDIVTGIAIGMANDLDLAFEKGQLHTSYITLGIYTDEGFAWSSASREDVLAQCASSDPAWGGHEEDIEVYLEIEGLEAINTSLIHHKHRFFLRDGNPAEAPAGYVEYVVACWFRALRFNQAVSAQIVEHGLPGNIPVATGTVDMLPEVASVHFAQSKVEQIATPVTELGSLITKAAPKRMAEVVELKPRNIRQQIAANSDNAEPEKKAGFFSKMFGR